MKTMCPPITTIALWPLMHLGTWCTAVPKWCAALPQSHCSDNRDGHIGFMIAYIYIYINISYIYIYTHILAIFLCIATFVMFIYFLKTVQSFPIIYLGNHLLKKASQLNDLWWVILGWFGAHFGVLLRSVKSFLINICKDVSWDRLVLFEILHIYSW